MIANVKRRTGKIAGLGHFPRKLGALDERMLSSAPASQLIQAYTTVHLGTKGFIFRYNVTFEKRRFD